MAKKITLCLISIILIFILIYYSTNENSSDRSGKNMEVYSVGDDYDHWFHLSGSILEKQEDCLRIELKDSDENIQFFDGAEILLDCSKDEISLESLSVGDHITFYFFKFNISGDTVKVEQIVHEFSQTNVETF